jgi:hypothetical protein
MRGELITIAASTLSTGSPVKGQKTQIRVKLTILHMDSANRTVAKSFGK